MSKHKNKTFSDRIKIRIRMLYSTLILMLVYMVIVGEVGLGDSRIMTQLAETVSRVIFFGGLVFIVIRIIHNKKLLENKILLLEQQKESADERQLFLHDKSGGVVVDILLLILMFVTCTTALWNMPAFYVSLGILIVTIVLKVASYIIYNKMY